VPAAGRKAGICFTTPLPPFRKGGTDRSEELDFGYYCYQ